MRAGQDGEPDDVDVLLQSGRHDHLGRLSKPRVDDFEALVAETASQNLGSTIMAVETGLGDENLERSISHAANDSGGRGCQNQPPVRPMTEPSTSRPSLMPTWWPLARIRFTHSEHR